MKVFFILSCLTIIALNIYGQDKIHYITLESLLDEMVSTEECAKLPEPCYTSHQESSYDRRSISPDRPGWFANNDGFGIIRVDTVNGRYEKVMFDEKGPGVITRIWITTIDKRGTWRFYFDGSTDARLIIPAYDLMQINIPVLGRGLLQPHTSYEPNGRGGNTLFLPIPYAKGCKITFEDEANVAITPKYYGINFRKYQKDVRVETFSEKIVKRNEQKISKVDKLLLNKNEKHKGKKVIIQSLVQPSKDLELTLPKGQNAIYELKIKCLPHNKDLFAQQMRQIIFTATFDDKETVWVPLSDFSGGGMGAPFVNSWYLFSDGNGIITSRWLMPYKKNATLRLLNVSEHPVTVEMESITSPLKWDDRSLYFHCSWKQKTGIYIHNNYDEDVKCSDWNFATIIGKGIYMGDLLSLYNHSARWYGEGDEKIWVDNDTFPSHFGTGTEDYYNSSWAPVYPFHTPFGGAPRADLPNSHGYNAFFRTRNLDGIPFKEKFKFDIEMLGWEPGNVDYSTTIYWYGDFDSYAKGTSGIDETKRPLVPAPYNPADYKVANALEFEDAKIVDKSSHLKVEKQSMHDFKDGKWSKAAHLLCTKGHVGDYVEVEFSDVKKETYKAIIYGTCANDYGVINFEINGKASNITFDGYSPLVINSEPINLGIVELQATKIKIKISIISTNKDSQGAHYYWGLDCLQLLPVD